MSVTITYDDTLARVRITATGLTAAADYATVERSTDQKRWTMVRGASQWPVSAGSFGQTLDDYEFTPGVANYYRVRAIVTDAPTFVAAGTADSGANGSRAPGAPAGIVAGDAVFILASTRNSGTGTVNTPTGWELVASSGNVALLGREYDGVWTMPTVTFTGGAVNEDTIARAAAWRGVDITAVTSLAQLNASAQNIAYPAITVPEDNCTILVLGWKQDDWTSVATLAGMTEVTETASTAGNDAGQVWDYVVQTSKANISAGSFVVTGGAGAISRGLVVVLPKQAYLNQQTASITPAQTGAWLKSVRAPYLNMPVTLLPRPDKTFAARGGQFNVVGRQAPIAVGDARASAAFPLGIRTYTAVERGQLELLLADGGILLLQVPAGTDYPSGYLDIRDVGAAALGANPGDRWILPAQIVAAPGSDVYGITGTCAAVVAEFATCADVVAEFATCADLMDWVASAADVIVS